MTTLPSQFTLHLLAFSIEAHLAAYVAECSKKSNQTALNTASKVLTTLFVEVGSELRQAADGQANSSMPHLQTLFKFMDSKDGFGDSSEFAIHRFFLQYRYPSKV